MGKNELKGKIKKHQLMIKNKNLKFTKIIFNEWIFFNECKKNLCLDEIFNA